MAFLFIFADLKIRGKGAFMPTTDHRSHLSVILILPYWLDFAH